MSYQIPIPPPIPPVLSNNSNIVENTMINKKDFVLGLETESPLFNPNLYTTSVINKLQPVLQSGPNCGLAALAMAASITPCCFNLEDFCSKAKSCGFSSQGEMFSVANMTILAKAMLSPWFEVTMFSGGLKDQDAFIISRLQEGDLFLVPYDADKNNYPCCKKGHKAHWTILCGLFTGKDGCIYVAARQGKSRHLGVWSFLDLHNSNSNLYELDPEREQDKNEYIIPCGGVKEGLAGKFIHLRRC